MISATDKRTPTASFSTGTPKPPEAGDMVMVQPTTTYMHGSDIVGPSSPPYLLSLHLAKELKNHGFATYEPLPPAPIDPPVEPDDPEDDTVEVDEEAEAEIERADDLSRAPDQNQVTASTVPARAGAEPVRPAPGPIPPAATSEPSKTRGRRGRRAPR